MRILRHASFVAVRRSSLSTAAAQSPDPLLADTRLTVHTLLREDIFAGFLDNNMDRVAQAEQNIEMLLQQRPDERANLLAWRAGAALQRAVARARGRQGRGVREALRDRARRTSPRPRSSRRPATTASPPIIGGTWRSSPTACRRTSRRRVGAGLRLLLAAVEAAGRRIEKMPVHFKGEVLAGLTQSAQRTGRTEESAQFSTRC